MIEMSTRQGEYKKFTLSNRDAEDDLVETWRKLRKDKDNPKIKISPKDSEPIEVRAKDITDMMRF